MGGIQWRRRSANGPVAASPSIRPVRRSTRALGCVAVAVAITALAWAGLATGALNGLQLRASDSVQPRGAATDDVVVVAVDEESLMEVGEQWPWPRRIHAQLIDSIAAAGARTIVVDILFAPEADGDEELGAAIAEAGNVILAETVRVDSRSDEGLITAELVSAPSESVAAAAAGSAQTAVLPDSYDGVIRRVPLLIDDGRVLRPSLSLAAVAAAEGEDGVAPIVRPDGVQIGERSIPTGEDAALTVSFAPELTTTDSPQVVSAADVLDGSVPRSELDGAVVFIGATDPTLGDRHLVPGSKQGGLPGVLVHANAYSTMVAQAYLAPESTAATLTTVFLLTLVVASAIQFLRLRWAVLVVGVVAVVVVAQGLLRADAGTVVNFVYPAVALSAGVPASIGLRYALEVRQRRTVSRLFSLYVPDTVADQLLESGLAEDAVRGQRLDISTMFCDLRGFTALSAQHDPAEVREMLDHYYEFASEIVMRHHGTLMQYVGDEVFAVFGTPVPDPQHSQHATDCAAALQIERPRLVETLAHHGLPPLTYGIGVNSGPVVAAHTGSSYRRQYTVIGDTVNTGARLCSQAGRHAVVISDAAAGALVDPPEMEKLGHLDMKGVRDDFVAWRLVLAGVTAEDR